MMMYPKTFKRIILVKIIAILFNICLIITDLHLICSQLYWTISIIIVSYSSLCVVEFLFGKSIFNNIKKTTAYLTLYFISAVITYPLTEISRKSCVNKIYLYILPITNTILSLYCVYMLYMASLWYTKETIIEDLPEYYNTNIIVHEGAI